MTSTIEPATTPATPSAALCWLITGASQGFGHSLVREALSRGDHVVAVVRDPSSLRTLAAESGARLTVLTADLLVSDDRARVVDALATADVDVLVNNAGRAICGAAEEVSMDELREQVELNFFAAAELARAAVPGMRNRGTGTVVQMSSQGGRLSFPGVGAYSAGKFALEGWSEALAGEVAPFGVRVMLVEPSRFRTGFNTAHSLGMTAGMEVYRSTVGSVREALSEIDGAQEGDPARAAAIIADIVHSDDAPLRLPLGAEAVRLLTSSYDSSLAGVRQWADVARAADFPTEVDGGQPRASAART